MAGRGVDVAIAGNGMLGMAVANELKSRSPDVRVAVVGPCSRPGAASRAAGAMLGCFGEVTKDTLATDPSRARFEISLRAHQRWPSFLDELRVGAAAGEELHVVAATDVILNTRSGYLDTMNFKAMLAALETFGEPWEEIDPSEIEGLNPLPDARPIRAVHLSEEKAVDGGTVMRLLEHRLEVAGVEFVDARVGKLSVKGNAVTGVALEDGNEIAADRVVLAAGAWTSQLLGAISPPNSVMPVLSGAGVALVGQRVLGWPFATVVRTPNRSGSCGLHLIPLGDGREYLGATNVVFAEPEMRTYVGVTHFLADCAMEQLDQRIFFHRIEESRMGNRPVTLDGFPLIGWSHHEGLYVVGGTYRDGFHGAPVIAEHAADQILGGPGTLDVPFDPNRRPIEVRTMKESIDEFVLHSEAGWFEAGARLPKLMPHDELGELLRPQVYALYETLGVEIGLGPDILMFLLASRKSPSDVTDVGRYLAAS